MLNRLGKRIAQFFYVNSIIKEKEDIEVYAYGLEILISSLSSILAVLLIGIFCNQLIGSILFFLAFIPLRTYSGGYHAKTHAMCFVILIVVYIINLISISYIADSIIVNAILMSMMFSSVVIYTLAPIDDKNKRLSEMQKKKYRRIALYILIAQIVIVTTLLMVGMSTRNLLAFTNGQLSASTSLIAVKINKRKDDKNERHNFSISQI